MKRKTTVTLRAGILTVGFHAARSPSLWRYDLSRNENIAVSVQGDGRDWDLQVTQPNGDYISAAHFEDREQAEEALAAIEKALAKRTSVANVATLAIYAALGAAIIAVVAAILVAANLVPKEKWLAPDSASQMYTTSPEG